MMSDVLRYETMHRHGQRGLFSLNDLPQRPPIKDGLLSCGWWELDQIWRIYPGQFTMVTGIPGHGKSTFLFNVIIQLAKTSSVRSFLYVPENESYLRETLRKIWGNDPGFDGFAKNDCMVQSAMPDEYDSEPRDLSWVLHMAVKAIREDETGLIVIDPWNELEHAKPRDVLMTDYIRLCLMYLKQFGRRHNVAIILVAHPTKAINDDGGRIPRMYDIEGSASWFNKMDNGLVVHRDFEGNSTKIISQKVRENGAGKIGSCYFSVDPATGIFTPQYGAVS